MAESKLRAEDIGLSHVAIIMDGNGRWASARALPRNMGHREGAKTLERVMRTFASLGVRYLTLYAFSTENWRRPRDEVEGLMKLIEGAIVERLLPRLRKKSGIAVRFIGDLSHLPPSLQARCAEAEALAKDAPMVCNIALNYGGREEIVQAVNRAIADGHAGVDADLLGSYLYTHDQPDPDLLIRTGGDLRVSGFLLWQIAYTEFIFTKTLWPDFGEEEIMECVREFARRKRRYGGLDLNSERPMATSDKGINE